jgi:hypothetical protein
MVRRWFSWSFFSRIFRGIIYIKFEKVKPPTVVGTLGHQLLGKVRAWKNSLEYIKMIACHGFPILSKM